MIEIELSFPELWNACCVGLQRHIVSTRRGYDAVKNRKAGTRANYQHSIEGAIGEACFAKFLGVFWACADYSCGSRDVGEWQVRATSHRNGCLIVKLDDPEANYALCVLTDSGAIVRGWMHSADARVERFWRLSPEYNGGVGAYWVPQSELCSFDEKPDVSTPEGEPYYVDGLRDEAADARRH